MRHILTLTQDLTDDEVHQLTTILLFHLVEKCGGQVDFTNTDAKSIVAALPTKMLHMRVSEDVTLRIVTRPPELQ